MEPEKIRIIEGVVRNECDYDEDGGMYYHSSIQVDGEDIEDILSSDYEGFKVRITIEILDGN